MCFFCRAKLNKKIQESKGQKKQPAKASEEDDEEDSDEEEDESDEDGKLLLDFKSHNFAQFIFTF